VQIEYDPVKAKYVAKDINTGLRILGHYDSTRLRAMCDDKVELGSWIIPQLRPHDATKAQTRTHRHHHSSTELA
jgi:hypothetical protein